MDGVIGILGATGEVGRAVTRLLSRHRLPLRLGTRHPSLLDGGEHEVMHADPADPKSLARFFAGCITVVNCTDLPCRSLAPAVFAAGADYVDPAGDDAGYDLLRGSAPQGRRAVLSAGLLPGLSELLARLAVMELGPVSRLRCYVGGLAPLTPAAARHFLPSDQAYAGESRSKRRRSSAPCPLLEITLPFFPDKVTACPYHLDRTAQTLGVPDARWYNVLPAGRADQALTRLWNSADTTGPDYGAENLRTAIRLDLIGRIAYHRLVVQAESAAGGTRTLVVSSSDGCEPAAVVTTAAVLALSDGRVPTGVHRAADLLDPGEIYTDLLQRPGITLTDLALSEPAWMPARIAG